MEGRTRRHQVLIVDDDADVRHQLAHFLRSKNHTPIEVASSEAARHWMTCNQADAMVLDISIPGSGGMKLVRELRGTEAWRHLPIMVLSPVRQSGEVVRAIGQGASDCFSKPFEPEVLVARLESHLRSHDLMLRLRKQNELLNRLAVLDELTQLYNRRAFMEALDLEVEHAARRDKPCTLMFLDLDHFKKVNDTLGHLVGDEVLQQVARRLEGAVRDGDVLGRFGGEEFCIVIPEVSLDLALSAGERLRRAISDEPFKVCDSGPIILTASVGVAWVAAGHPTSPKSMVNVADRAMYRAKHQGRDQVAVAEVINEAFEADSMRRKVATPNPD